MDKEVLIALIGFAGAVVPSVIGLFAKKQPASDGGVSTAQWISLMILAATISGLLAGVVGQLMPDVVVLGPASPHVANWAFFGAMIGGAQWRTLHAAGHSPRLWVIATVIGWTPCAFFFTEPYAWPAFGLLSGAMQALFCPRTVQRAVVWISINGVAWTVAGLLGTAIGAVLLPSTGFALAWILGWACVGGIAGIITALALRLAIVDPVAAHQEVDA